VESYSIEEKGFIVCMVSKVSSSCCLTETRQPYVPIAQGCRSWSSIYLKGSHNPRPGFGRDTCSTDSTSSSVDDYDSQCSHYTNSGPSWHYSCCG
jgi:hypothetical protein